MVRAEAYSPKLSPGRDSAAEFTKLHCAPPRPGILPCELGIILSIVMD